MHYPRAGVFDELGTDTLSPLLPDYEHIAATIAKINKENHVANALVSDPKPKEEKQK